MKANTLRKTIVSIKRTAVRHSPEILTIVGITGMIGTTFMAVRATPKALELIEAAEFDKGTGYDANSEIVPEPLTPVETVKVAWKCYVPSVLLGSFSVICLIGANSVNMRRNAAIAAAYAISESKLKEYQEKVIKEIGEKKEESIRDSIAKDRIDKNPVTNNEVILTNDGTTLCYDVLSGRYFKSDINKLKKAENEINRLLRSDTYISLNDFYYEIGLDPIKVGYDLGWCIDDGYMELDFSSQLIPDGTPCLVVDYHVAPKYDFSHI